MKIRVTRDDIKKGKQLDNACPIAVALKRQLLSKDVRVRYYYVVINEITHIVSMEVTRFVTQFDRGEKVKPFSFILNEKR